MKCTTLLLDEKLLEEATALSGAKTYSKAVSLALLEYIRKIKARRLLTFAGSGIWEGNLDKMRTLRKTKQ